MKWIEYTEKAKTTAIFPKDSNYLYLGLIGEVGELAEKLKKEIRDGTEVEYVYEVGDVLWYTALIADKLGVDLDSVIDQPMPPIPDLELAVVTLAYHSSVLVNEILDGDTDYAYLLSELVSSIVYVLSCIEYSLDEAMELNISKLSSRAKRDKLRGSGDLR